MSNLSSPRPARNASLIYMLKESGEIWEFLFHAKDEDDLKNKGEMAREMRQKDSYAAVYGWLDDPALNPLRKNLVFVQ